MTIATGEKSRENDSEGAATDNSDAKRFGFSFDQTQGMSATQPNLSAQHQTLKGSASKVKMPGLLSAFASFNFMSLFKGINITPNHLLILLFLFFFFWLFVVYWIRHNEPLANQVLGSSHAFAPTAQQDRHLINGVKEAYPVRTSPTSGQIWTPPIGIHDSNVHGGQQAPQQMAAPAPVQIPVQPHAPARLAGVDPMATQMHAGAQRLFSAHQQPMGAQQQALMQQQQAFQQSQWSLANGGYQQAPATYSTQFGSPMTNGVMPQGPAQMAPMAGTAPAQTQIPGTPIQQIPTGNAGIYHHAYQTEGGPRLKMFTNR